MKSEPLFAEADPRTIHRQQINARSLRDILAQVPNTANLAVDNLLSRVEMRRCKWKFVTSTPSELRQNKKKFSFWLFYIFLVHIYSYSSIMEIIPLKSSFDTSKFELRQAGGSFPILCSKKEAKWVTREVADAKGKLLLHLHRLCAMFLTSLV